MLPTNLRIIARPSLLAAKQAEEIMASFPKIAYKVIAVKSQGDKDKKLSLSSKDAPNDFFTRELDAALIAGAGDIAVHSAKDLPWPLAPGLAVIALTKGIRHDDVLVSKNNLELAQLPAGAVVGTSSLSRQRQVLAQRPDLKIRTIRGTIQERLKLVDSRKIDALVVAGCALERLKLSKRIAQKLKFAVDPLQGRLAVVARIERVDLKALFSKIDIYHKFGKVFLVGATTAEHLTRKADQALKRADVIFYDDLVERSLLADYSARKIYVGKRKGRPSIGQDEINVLLWRGASQGKTVARVKAGDPLVFSRGGEEIEYLQKHLVEVEVVPGLSYAQIAAADNLIPLTKRGVASRLVFISGHNIGQTTGESLVYFMAASKLKEISLQLLASGQAKTIPAVLIRDAGLPSEQVITTDLGRLGDINIDSPVILIIGEVVRQTCQREKILFLGLDPSSCKLKGQLVHYPLIRVELLDRKISKLNKYDAILFTSRNGAKAFLGQNIVKKQLIIAIGPATKQAVESYGYRVAYMPKKTDSASLLKLVKTKKFKRILYPTSQLSSNRLHDLPNVAVEVVYQTKYLRQPKLDLDKYSGLVFSSSSTVRAYFKIYKKIPRQLLIYVYGQQVKDELAKRGYRNVQALSS